MKRGCRSAMLALAVILVAVGGCCAQSSSDSCIGAHDIMITTDYNAANPECYQLISTALLNLGVPASTLSDSSIVDNSTVTFADQSSINCLWCFTDTSGELLKAIQADTNLSFSDPGCVSGYEVTSLYSGPVSSFSSGQNGTIVEPPSGSNGTTAETPSGSHGAPTPPAPQAAKMSAMPSLLLLLFVTLITCCLAVQPANNVYFFTSDGSSCTPSPASSPEPAGSNTAAYGPATTAIPIASPEGAGGNTAAFSPGTTSIPVAGPGPDTDYAPGPEYIIVPAGAGPDTDYAPVSGENGDIGSPGPTDYEPDTGAATDLTGIDP